MVFIITSIRHFDAYDAEYITDLLREGNVLYTRNNESIRDLLGQRREVPKLENPNAFNDSITQSDPESKPQLRTDGGWENGRQLQARNFSEDKYFARTVEKWQSLNRGGLTRVGRLEQDSPLVKAGLLPADVYINNSKLMEELEKHGDHLTSRIVAKIPQLLNDPILVNDPGVVRDKLTAAIDVYGDVEGFSIGETPVLVGVTIAKDRSGRYTINKINTIHARSNWQDTVSDESVLYLNPDKKRTKAWFQARGTSVPLGGTKFGSIKSIAHRFPHDNTNFRKSDDQSQLRTFDYGRFKVPGSVKGTFGATTGSVAGTTPLDEISKAAGNIKPKHVMTQEEKKEAAAGRVLTELPKEEASLKEKLQSSFNELRRRFVDVGQAIYDLSAKTKDPSLYAAFNDALNSKNRANFNIGGIGASGKETGYQTDLHGEKIGDSLFSLWKEAKRDPETYKQFQLYLLHRHNVDRARKGKHVFGELYTGTESKKLALSLETEHPEFKEWAEPIYEYSRNLLLMRAEAGLISYEDAAQFMKDYPHYVPTFRLTEDVTREEIRNAVVFQTVGKAKGGKEQILPIDLAMSRQTVSAWNNSLGNMMGERLYKAANTDRDTVRRLTDEERKKEGDVPDTFVWDSEDGQELTHFDNHGNFLVYRNGKATGLKVDKSMLEGLKAMLGQGRNITLVSESADNAVAKFTNAWKSVITTYNPVFMLKNPLRDVQDALLYSKHPAGFVKNFCPAFMAIIKGDPVWLEYQAMGGAANSFYDYNEGMLAKADKTGLKKVIARVDALNRVAEQAPRLAEYMAAKKDYEGQPDAKLRAAYDATDITTNFGRGGDMGRYINRTYVPFFNPAMQGMDKFVRTFTETHHLNGEEKTFVARWLPLAVRFAVLGFGAGLLNELLFHDNENYQLLSERQKNRNYVIPVGDGKFIAIPKGRVLSVIAATARTATQGKEGDWGEVLTLATEQIAPASPIQDNILAPLFRTKLLKKDDPGKTWYGSDLENEGDQTREPWLRYDEKTTLPARAIGRVFNLSPKKLDALFDAYTGVVGDILLPLLDTDKTTMPLTSSFSADAVYSNDLSNALYEMKQEYVYDKKNPALSEEERAVASLMDRYFNGVTGDISDLYAKMDEFKTSDLSKKEIAAETRLLQKEINELRAAAVAMAPLYEEAAREAWISAEGDEHREDVAKREAYRTVFGAETALMEYSKAAYESAAEANGATGLTFEEFYDYYFTVRGGKADEIRDGLLSMELSEEERQFLWGTTEGRAGDINAYGEAREALRNNVDYQSLSAEDQTAVLNNVSYYHGSAEADRDGKASAAVICGWSVDEYYVMKQVMGDITGDDKKERIEGYLRGAGLSEGETAMFMILAGNYRSKEIRTDAMRYIVELIEGGVPREEIAELLDLIGYAEW